MREIGPRPSTYHPNPAHWAKIRGLALERDRGCRACGDTDGLEVHHRDYSRFGREELADVTVFCRVCHDAITGLMMRVRDDRRALPTERLVISVERFVPQPDAESPPPVRVTAEIERHGPPPTDRSPAPVRVTAEIERFPNALGGDLPPPGRNVR